jgi:hypothetical protein
VHLDAGIDQPSEEVAGAGGDVDVGVRGDEEPS